jgi:hypothetical protein
VFNSLHKEKETGTRGLGHGYLLHFACDFCFGDYFISLPESSFARLTSYQDKKHGFDFYLVAASIVGWLMTYLWFMGQANT